MRAHRNWLWRIFFTVPLFVVLPVAYVFLIFLVGRINEGDLSAGFLSEGYLIYMLAVTTALAGLGFVMLYSILESLFGDGIHHGGVIFTMLVLLYLLPWLYPFERIEYLLTSTSWREWVFMFIMPVLLIGVYAVLHHRFFVRLEVDESIFSSLGTDNTDDAPLDAIVRQTDDPHA